MLPVTLQKASSPPQAALTRPMGAVESPWPMAATVVAAGVLGICRPDWLGVAPSWALPIVWTVPLVLLLVADRAERGRHAHAARWLSIVVVCMVAMSAVESATALTLDIVMGKGHTATAVELLWVSGIVWGLNIAAFGLVFWEFDGGGPRARASTPKPYLDFSFPQTINPDLAPPGWTPRFFDYLYLGFTNMTAFSPTDVMPLTRRAKAVMAVQAIVSLLILVLVVSRAINIMN